jgi:serine/threonine-protein kinase
MAPEQALGRWDVVGPRSDVWSTGAMMFSLLSGELVFEEATVAALLAALVNGRTRSLAEVCPDLAASVVRVVDRALQRDLGSRWPHARAMQRALREAYAEVYGKPMPAPPIEEEAVVRPSHVVRLPQNSTSGTVVDPRGTSTVAAVGGVGRWFARRPGPTLALLGALLAAATFVASHAVGRAPPPAIAPSAAGHAPPPSAADLPSAMMATPIAMTVTVSPPPVASASATAKVSRAPVNLRAMFDRRH